MRGSSFFLIFMVGLFLILCFLLYMFLGMKGSNFYLESGVLIDSQLTYHHLSFQVTACI
jgi:hypothetical protein